MEGFVGKGKAGKKIKGVVCHQRLIAKLTVKRLKRLKLRGLIPIIKESVSKIRYFLG
jgi:hypothetical protein